MAAAPTPSHVRLPWRIGLGAGLVVSGVLLALQFLGAFELLDLRLHDWRYRLRGPLAASDRIAIIEVDDPTIAAFRTWPLPRSNYALLIDALERADVQSIGFDLLFLGESPEDSVGDRVLAAVTAGHSNIVHAIAFQPEDATLGDGALPTEVGREVFARHGRPARWRGISPARRVSLPYDALLEACDALGHTAVAVDRDGVVRRIPQFVRYGDWAYPSLSIRVVETAARSDSVLPQFELADDGVYLLGRGRRVPMPVDAQGATSIVYAGDRPSFRHMYSLLQVLQWAAKDDTASLRRAFAGKLVIVGTTAVGEVATDVGATPWAEATPRVFVHANAVNAALQGRFLARVSNWSVGAALLSLGLLLGLVFSWLPLGASAGVAVAAVLAVAGADLALFVFADTDAPAGAALLLAPLVWIGVEGFRREFAERVTRERAKELDIARGIQQHLLPSGPPDVAEAEVFGLNLPADAVGGDYYDWLELGEDDLAIVVGDISGHGIPAALLMAHLRASFHAEARPGRAPAEIVDAIHRSLLRAATPGRFATFFLAIVSRRTHELRFCNAGHNPPLLVRGQQVEMLAATGIPLAMIEGVVYGEGTREFMPGDTLVLYSDGVTEAPFKQEFYGEERWERQVLACCAKGLGAREMVQELIADVRAFARDGLTADDVTLVVVRRTVART